MTRSGVATELSFGASGSVESGEVTEWKVAEVVLRGSLDDDLPASVDSLTNSPVTPAPSVAGVDRPRKLTRQAWITATADLAIVPSALAAVFVAEHGYQEDDSVDRFDPEPINIRIREAQDYGWPTDGYGPPPYYPPPTKAEPSTVYGRWISDGSC